MSFNSSSSFIAETQQHPCEELKPAHYVQTGYKAWRRVKVNWADRYNWAIWFCQQTSYPYFSVAGLGGQAVVTGVKIEPDDSQITHGGDAISEAQYIYAFITLHYQPCGLNGGDALIEEFLPR